MIDTLVNLSKDIINYRYPALAVLLVLSLVSFCLYGIDKWKAKHGKWRISEKALLLSAFFFGGIGAFFGMKLFRHKTQHWYFRLLVPLFLILQLAVVAFVVIAGLFI